MDHYKRQLLFNIISRQNSISMETISRGSSLTSLKSQLHNLMKERKKDFQGKRTSTEKPSLLAIPTFNMSKTEQSLNLSLMESFREAQEEEQMPLFSRVQNANASGS